MIVTTARGCEAALAEEVKEILLAHGLPGGNSVLIQAASVVLESNWPGVVALNLLLRCASRVLWQVASFSVGFSESIFERTLALPWSSWFGVEHSFAVFGSVKGEFQHGGARIALEIKDAIADSMRQKFHKRPDVDKYDPDVGVYFRIQDGEFSLCLDTTGVTLEKRGYRPESGEAPLKESIAASLLRYMGWPAICSSLIQKKGEADAAPFLYDPLCGSGTLLIEAALMATKKFPQLHRNSFSFVHFYPYQRVCAPEFLDAFKQNIRKNEELVCENNSKNVFFMGADQDQNALDMAARNAQRAGVGHLIHWECGQFFDREPPRSQGILITNPPYGVRLEGDASFFREMGNVFKRRYGGWTCYVYSGSEEGNKAIGLRPSKKVRIPNGSIPAVFMAFPMRPFIEK